MTDGLTNLTNLVVDIMFCAAPQQLVGFTDKKRSKNLFYNVFCFYVPSIQQYIVFCKFYKKSKKKNSDGTYIKSDKKFTNNYTSEDEVCAYLNKFLSCLTEHDRFINEIATVKDKMPASEAIKLMNEWELLIFECFNTPN